MLPRKSSTRPIRQPWVCSRSAVCDAEPPGADWLRTSTRGRISAGVVLGGGDELVASGLAGALLDGGVAVADDESCPEPAGSLGEAAVTSSSRPAPVQDTMAVMTAAMATTASSWVRKRRSSWPTGPCSGSGRLCSVIGSASCCRRVVAGPLCPAHHGGHLAGRCSVLDLPVRSLDVGGRTLGYRRTGNGPPMVLLHGGLSESREWLPVMERASGFADLLALDAPGCGASGDPTDGSSLSDLADTVAAVVEALDL